MNKKILLIPLPLLTLLIGCGENSSSSIESSSIDEATRFSALLNELKTGYKLDLLFNQRVQVIGGNESVTNFYQYSLVSSSENAYRKTDYKMVTDLEKLNKDAFISDAYYTNKEGKLCQSTLTIENKIEEKEYLDSTSSSVSWKSSNLVNFFSVFEDSDFLKNENNEYVLTKKLNALERHSVAAQTLGIENYNEPIDSISITFEGEEAYLNASFQTYQAVILEGIASANVTDSFKAKIISHGEAVTPLAPIAKEEDETFANAFSELQSLNFKTTVKNYEIKYKDGRYELVDQAIGYVTPHSVATTITNKNDEIITDDAYFIVNGQMQKAVRYGDKYYASRTPSDRAISSLFPSFKISSAFFSKNGDTYTLDKKYTGIISSTYLFSPFVNDDIEELEIKISDSKIEITSSSSGNGVNIFGEKEEFTYEEFGTQSAFDGSQITYDASSLTWKTMIRDKDDYRELVSETISEEILNKIPVFGGVYSEAYFMDSTSSMIPYIYTTVNSYAEARELEKKYKEELPLAGFAYNEESESYEIKSGSSTLQVLPLPYSGDNESYIFALAFNTVSEE